MSYNEYTLRISRDIDAYGDCTQKQANRIADRLTKMVQVKFPGIRVTASGRGCDGPDSDVVYEIETWVNENWDKAL